MIIGGPHMNQSLKAVLAIFQKLLSILNIVIVLLIIINIFNLILTFLQKENYISFLDYTYIIIEENNNDLELKKGDFILVDLKKSAMKEDLVLIQEEGNLKLGKIIEIGTENVLVKTEGIEEEIAKDCILGKAIKVIPILGNILNILLTPIVLIILIITMILINLIQYFLKKTRKKANPIKPDFKKMNEIKI